MEGEVPRWTVEEVRTALAGATVHARDRVARPLPVPPGLHLPPPSRVDESWEAQSRSVHEPDMAALMAVWWAALADPGRLHELTLRSRADDGWHRRSVTVLDLRHQRDVGVILVGSRDLGPCAAPDTSGRLRDMTADDEEVAYFERPVWLLQELDGLGCVLNTEGDAELIFGCGADELRGESVLRFLHPGDHGPAIQMWTALLGDPGGSRTIRQRILQPDGSQRWIESTVLNRLGADGEGVVLSISHDITERRRHERDLRYRALTDPLTDLPNRLALDAALDEQLRVGSATVAFVDLDGFKSVNDRLGHHVGDQVLEAVAARLDNGAPEGAIVGRWGGDEFVLVGPDDCEDELRSTIDRAFADPITVGDDQWHPSCSYGFAHGSAAGDADALIRSADTAMYAAKDRRAG